MTTIRALEASAERPSVGEYMPITLVDVEDKRVELVAPLEQLRRSLADSGGVGRFQLDYDGAPHLAIAERIVGGARIEDASGIVMREVRQTDVIRMRVPLVVVSLPASVQNHQAQAVRKQRFIEVRSAIYRIPERIQIDLSTVGIGQSLQAKHLVLPRQVDLVTPSDTVLFEIRAF